MLGVLIKSGKIYNQISTILLYSFENKKNKKKIKKIIVKAHNGGNFALQ